MNSGQFAVYLIFLDHKSNYFERLSHLLLREACCSLRGKKKYFRSEEDGYNNFMFSTRGKIPVLETGICYYSILSLDFVACFSCMWGRRFMYGFLTFY